MDHAINRRRHDALVQHRGVHLFRPRLPGPLRSRGNDVLQLRLKPLRLGPMLELGRRFVSVVALQPDHTVHTGGFYTWVRHPSYLGILLMDLGFAGVFRSVIALALMPMVIWMFKRRMDVEETFMVDQFGGQYRDYMGNTRRILPGLY